MKPSLLRDMNTPVHEEWLRLVSCGVTCSSTSWRCLRLERSIEAVWEVIGAFFHDGEESWAEPSFLMVHDSSDLRCLWPPWPADESQGDAPDSGPGPDRPVRLSEQQLTRDPAIQ